MIQGESTTGWNLVKLSKLMVVALTPKNRLAKACEKDIFREVYVTLNGSCFVYWHRASGFSISDVFGINLVYFDLSGWQLVVAPKKIRLS